MNILVISGYNPKDNSSADLSHNAYINGMLQLGYQVDLLCYSDYLDDSDSQSEIPNVNNMYTFDGLSLYEKMANRRGGNSGVATEDSDGDAEFEQNQHIGMKQRLITKTKRLVRSLYGIYNPSIMWFVRAKKFKSDVDYDFVVSMSYPQVSHLVAKFLIEKKSVNYKKWVQLWEDPWAADLGNMDGFEKCLKPEGKLLDAAEDIVYVSPITMEHQKAFFPNNKEKMRWCPLASYYHSRTIDYPPKYTYYGYFGDYSPQIRNLEPFYNVAVNRYLNVDICGSPSDLFSSKNNVKIYPRLQISELQKHEDKANIVICLFNLGGGQIPGKIYQLAATNKTILAILDGPEDEQRIIRDYFEKYNRFVFCQNNEQSISEAIVRIENNDLGSVSNEPINDFSVEKVAKMLLGD